MATRLLPRQGLPPTPERGQSASRTFLACYRTYVVVCDGFGDRSGARAWRARGLHGDLEFLREFGADAAELDHVAVGLALEARPLEVLYV